MSNPRLPTVLLLLVLLLAATAVALQAVALTRDRPAGGRGASAELDELREELSISRHLLAQQAERLTRLLDRLAREGGGGSGGSGAAAPADPAGVDDSTPTRAAVEALVELHLMHARYQHDPLQREPIERKRAAVEEILRKRGDEAVDAIASILPDVPSTRAQTRLLTHVVGPIGTRGSFELGMEVLRDPTFGSGVRLVGAQVALDSDRDVVVDELIGLLDAPDPSFDRPSQIILFFHENPEPRALPSLTRIATDRGTERSVRRFALQALAAYPQPESVEALKRVADDTTYEDLRGEALHSLNTLLGREVLDFVRYLRGRLAADDPIRNLLDSIEAQWRQ